jgi:hypothetical protein
LFCVQWKGYSDSVPLSLAQNNQTLIAVFMNGEKLPVDHGFPARLLVPGLFGMENVKWLNAIEPIAGSYAGFWQQRGWEKFAQVNTMSKFTLPQNGASLAADQPVQLAGVAFAGSRGIRRVEVAAMPASHMEGSSQNLQWNAAELVPGNSEITWVLWKYSWRPPAKPGNYMLLVRATDGTGGLQTAQRAPTFPNGATGYHTVQVQVA